MEYRYGSHTVYKIRYHFVFVTKYRYQVLKGDIGLKVRELIRQTCPVGRHFWARGYFCVTSGELTEEMIKEHLDHHFEPRVDDNFRAEA